MRTSEATINLVLNKQRPNKNGQMPVYLRIMFHNEKKHIKTDVYVPENQWDTKRQQVKSSFAGFSETNKKLDEIRRKYTEIRDGFIRRGIEYTVADIVAGDKVKTGISTSLLDVLESMARHKGLCHNTVMAYRASVRRLGEAGVSRIEEISPDGVQGLCKRLKANGLSDSSVNGTMSCLCSLWRYGADLGICEGNLSSRFKYWLKYKIAERRVILTTEEIGILLRDFVSRCVDKDKGTATWTYRNEAYWALMNRNSELFAQACFLLCYHLQGLAFADLVRIKAENISVIEVDGMDCYCISGLKRKKTNKTIADIIVEQDEFTMPLFEIFVQTMNERDGYFLPVLQNNKREYRYGNDQKKITEATGAYSGIVNNGLRSVFSRLGFDVSDATFYCARHSFATHFIMSGGNPVILADLMGRSVNGIFRYVTGLTSHEQNLKERSRVFGRK